MFGSKKSAPVDHENPMTPATLAAAQAWDSALVALEEAHAVRARVQELDTAVARELADETKRVEAVETDPARKAAARAYARGEGARPANVDVSRRSQLQEDRALRARELAELSAEIQQLEADVTAKRDAFMGARLTNDLAPQIRNLRATMRRLIESAGGLALLSESAAVEFQKCGLYFEEQGNAVKSHFKPVLYPAILSRLPVQDLPERVIKALT